MGATHIHRFDKRDAPEVATLLEGEHYRSVADGIYREARVTANLSSHVLCVWYRRIGLGEAARPVRIMPDGCMDLIWTQSRLLIAGPDTTAWVNDLDAGAEIAGLRFRPGAAIAAFGVPATELVNDRPLALTVLGRWAAEATGRLEASQSVTDVAAILQDAVCHQLVGAPGLDPIVQYVVRSVQQARGVCSVRVDDLANNLGISERQLHRRCCAALGYGPKTFARIVRFQEFLTHARKQTLPDLAHLAADTGYADQSHLTREVRRLAGLTPTELVADLSH